MNTTRKLIATLALTAAGLAFGATVVSADVTPATATSPAVRGITDIGTPSVPTTTPIVDIGTPPVPSPEVVPTHPACPAGSTVVVVGDSITELGAADLRQSLIHAGYTPWINARGGRTIPLGDEPVWGFGEEVGVQRCWVIALGTNDTWLTPPAEYLADITTLLSHVKAGEPIWWVSVAVPGGVAINALVPVPLITWQPTPDVLLPDGVHPTPAGRVLWASLVMASLTAPV